MVKPDQLIKRRGKLGLIKVNTDLAGVKAWVTDRMNKDTKVILICCCVLIVIVGFVIQ